MRTNRDFSFYITFLDFYYLNKFCIFFDASLALALFLSLSAADDPFPKTIVLSIYRALMGRYYNDHFQVIVFFCLILENMQMRFQVQITFFLASC